MPSDWREVEEIEEMEVVVDALLNGGRLSRRALHFPASSTREMDSGLLRQNIFGIVFSGEYIENMPSSRHQATLDW